MTTFEKINKLLKKSHRNQGDLTDHLGIAKSTYTLWKTGKSDSYMQYIPEIAAFFNVSTNFLSADDT